jgi:hypothetical protein
MAQARGLDVEWSYQGTITKQFYNPVTTLDAGQKQPLLVDLEVDPREN